MILLAPDTLRGPGNTNVDFRGKSVVVCPESGWDSTVIDCELVARGFIFQSGEDSLTVLTGLTIINGRANFYGGAVYCRSASPTIAGNVFINNQSGYQGGAIYCDSSSAIIFDNVFRYNGAPEGGGLWCSGGSELHVWRNRFERNGAAEMGGALACDASSPLICDNLFMGNQALYGAAVEAFAGSGAIIRGNVFQDNIAGDGGGVRCRRSSASTVIQENVFWENIAGGRGGAIHFEDNSLGTIQSNTIVQNHGGRGAGIFCTDFSDPDIEFNIVVNCSTGGAVEIENFSRPWIHCCDFYGNEGGNDVPAGATDGGNNFSTDPLFCSPDDGDFRLSASSPCLPENNDSCSLIGARSACTPTGVRESTAFRPMRLDPNVPNPFNIETTIRFHLDRDRRDIRVRVYDVSGALVRTLFDGPAPAGPNTVTWDGRDQTGSIVSSGVYFCLLSTPGYKEAKKMVLLK
jgi:predicted outer membrane repeat protein